jgi:hypothetical protein
MTNVYYIRETVIPETGNPSAKFWAVRDGAYTPVSDARFRQIRKAGFPWFQKVTIENSLPITGTQDDTVYCFRKGQASAVADVFQADLERSGFLQVPTPQAPTPEALAYAQASQSATFPAPDPDPIPEPTPKKPRRTPKPDPVVVEDLRKAAESVKAFELTPPPAQAEPLPPVTVAKQAPRKRTRHASL